MQDRNINKNEQLYSTVTIYSSLFSMYPHVITEQTVKFMFNKNIIQSKLKFH